MHPAPFPFCDHEQRSSAFLYRLMRHDSRNICGTNCTEVHSSRVFLLCLKKQSNSCLGCTFSYGKESSQYFSCKKCAPFRKLIHIIYQMWKRKSSALQAFSQITWQNINGGVEQDREHGQFFKLMCPSSSDFFPHKRTFKVQSKGKEGELFNTQPFHETVFLQSGQCRAIWIRLSSARHPVLVNWERWSYWDEIWQHCWKWSDSTNRSVNL